MPQLGGGGDKSLVVNAFFYGGDRWFVYVMFLVYAILIPFKKQLDKQWLPIILCVALTGVYFLNIMPEFMKLDDVFYYMVFFLSGYMLKDGWQICDYYGFLIGKLVICAAYLQFAILV